MAKIKTVDGYQKKVVTEEQVELYRPFGWEKEKNSKEIVKKQTMYTVKRKEAIAKNKAVVASEKKYLKLEKKICKKKPGFFSIVFFLVGVALAVLEFVDVGFKASSFLSGIDAIKDYANLIVAGVGGVVALICLFCPSGKPKYGKYKKAKQKKLFPKMVALTEKASEDLYKLKVENKSLMNKKESKNYDIQTVIKRAIKEIREEDDD